MSEWGPRLTFTYIFAFMIQSRSSSPSSGPPGPPWTGRKSLGRHSMPLSTLAAASWRCLSSIFVFSAVATSWFLARSASTVSCQSFCDSRSSCSSNGLATGGVCFAFVASNRSSFWPVCPYRQHTFVDKRNRSLTYSDIFDEHFSIPVSRKLIEHLSG